MSLNVINVSKDYKEKKALDNIVLNFEPDTIYGLLGRNGAGKSTLLNIINNRNLPSEGSVELDGSTLFDNEAVLNKVYLMSEDNLYPASMKVKEMFKISEKFYQAFDWDLANQMLDAFELSPKLVFKKLSTGYRSISKLIIALCVPCDYVFLDEPVLGLDATHREMFGSFIIDAYEKRSRTFVISTHLIEEISTLLEKVIVMDRGSIKVDSSMDDLLAQLHTISGPKDVIDAFSNQVEIISKEQLGEFSTIYVKGHLPEIVPSSLVVSSLSLQNYFVQLTKRK